MSKRIQPEVRIMQFFESATIEAAQMMLSLCQSMVKRRLVDEVTTVPVRRRRKARKALGVTSAEKAAILGDQVQ